MSYKGVCEEIDNPNTSYLIHEYQSLEQNLFPLYSIQCISNSPNVESTPFLVINGSIDDYIINNLVLNQIYIIISHKYCPQECYECDIPLWDETKDPRRTLFLQDWIINKPMTAGWNITTSEFSYQQIIKSVEVYIYGLTTKHEIQITVYDHSANKYLSQSIKYKGESGKNKYEIELPIKNNNNEYNYLLPNHQYVINIQLYNIKSSDADSIQIVLQNITDIYYSPTSYDHFTNINGLLFIYSEYFNFNVAHNALSLYTPFGSLCIICIGQNDTLPLPPTTPYPSQSPTISSPTTLSPTTSSPTTSSPSINPTTFIPTTAKPTQIIINPTNDPTFEPTQDPTSNPTNEPTIDPTQIPTNEPTLNPTVTLITNLPTTPHPTNMLSKNIFSVDQS